MEVSNVGSTQLAVQTPKEVVVIDCPKHSGNKLKDTFEKHQMPSSSQVVFAAGLTKLAFPKIKAVSTSIPNVIENAVKNVVTDFGKEFKGMPKNFNPAVKYATMLGGTLSFFGLMLKDSDNDGSLDLFQGIKKFLLPEAVDMNMDMFDVEMM